MPLASLPMKLGWKSTSGQRKRSLPTVMMLLAGSLHLRVKIQSDVAEFLLDVAHDLALSSGGERVAALCENLHEIFCEITTSKVEAQNCVWQCIALVDGHSVGDAVTRIHDDASGAARGVERQHGLNGNIHSRR